MESTYRKTLGVTPEATFQEIRKTFLTRVRELHPDKGGDPETFRQFYESYKGLKDILSKESSIESSTEFENESDEPEKWWEWMTWMGRWMKRMAKGGETLRMKIAWNYIGKTIQFDYDNIPIEVSLDAPIKQVQGGLRIQVIPIIVEPSLDSGKVQCFWNDTHWIYLIQKTEDSSGGFQIKGGERLEESSTSSCQLYLQNSQILVIWTTFS
jgi:hypothetical protein